MKVLRPAETVESWVGKQECSHCWASLEFTAKDIFSRKNYDGWAESMIKCPCCGTSQKMIRPIPTAIIGSVPMAE